MFQQDTSEFELRSSEPVHRSAEGPLPLWLRACGAVCAAVNAAAAASVRIVDALQRHHREAVTVRELSALRDRELRDIGIERDEIPLIARSMAHDGVDPRRNGQAPGHPAEAKPALVRTHGPLQPCCG